MSMLYDLIFSVLLLLLLYFLSLLYNKLATDFTYTVHILVLSLSFQVVIIFSIIYYSNTINTICHKLGFEVIDLQLLLNNFTVITIFRFRSAIHMDSRSACLWIRSRIFFAYTGSRFQDPNTDQHNHIQDA